MKRFEKWQLLDQYYKQGVFAFVDLVFAQRALKKLNSEKEEHAALLATLFALSRKGHLSLDLSQNGLNVALQLLSVSSPDDLTELLQRGAAAFPAHGITDIQGDSNDIPNAWICRLGMHYYLQKNWVYESEVLKHLERLSSNAPAISLSVSSFDPRLNEAQKSAVENTMRNNLSLLSGGPGTGKTFTAAQIVKTYLHALSLEKRDRIRIILTAPTGKAVAQLEGNLRNDFTNEVSIRSGTLHALLGVKENGEEEEEIKMFFADLILVDECSMVDVKIFSRLLASIPAGARVILIGDKDQLPPIESGSIFADILDADVFPSTHLTQCLRSDCSEILTFSQLVKRGDDGAALEFLEDNPNLSWVDFEKEKKTSMQLCADLWEQYKGHCATYYLDKPFPEEILKLLGRFILLSSMRQGPLGVDVVNRYFLHQSIKQAPKNCWLAFPIIVTRNDYEMQLYNGDLGLLVRKLTPEGVAKLQFGTKSALFAQDSDSAQIAYSQSSMSIFAETESVQKSSNLASKASFATPSSKFSLHQFELEDYILFQDRKGGYRQIAALSLTSFEYSYCLSVHKSQGSEYDEVIVLIPPGSERFGREVLYTAVTRARNKISLMCAKDLLVRIMTTSSRKISGLRARLKLKPKNGS